MSDDPLDETIRGSAFRDGKPASLNIDGNEIPVWLRDDVPPNLILIEVKTLVYPLEIDALKQVGFGTCHVKGPDGKMRLVGVSIVAPKKPRADESANRIWDGIYSRLMHDDPKLLIEYRDGAGRRLPSGEGNLMIDDVDALNTDEFRAAYANTYAGRLEMIHASIADMGRTLRVAWGMSWPARIWARLAKLRETGE